MSNAPGMIQLREELELLLGIDIKELTFAETAEKIKEYRERTTPTSDTLMAPEQDKRPHSRACGIHVHNHGPACAPDCPTCGNWTKQDEM